MDVNTTSNEMMIYAKEPLLSGYSDIENRQQPLKVLVEKT